MKLGLTIAYRLLWVIELAWGGFFLLGALNYSSLNTFEFWFLSLTGVIGVALLHIVFTSPIGKKLAEDKADD